MRPWGAPVSSGYHSMITPTFHLRATWPMTLGTVS